MKNPLQLELQLKIKKANKFLISKKYSAAIEKYSQGLQLYQMNHKFNEIVSQQFQSLLYSFRGYSYSLNFQSEHAQQDFAQSLKINPYNPLTLSRRAKHFMKEKRFCEAIVDIDLALLYDPQNLNYMAMIITIQNYINQMEDEVEKTHLKRLAEEVKERFNVKNTKQTSSDEQDDEQILNFAKLKKIDRVSLRINSSKFISRKSVIQFKEDELLVYEKQDQANDTESDTIKVSSEKQIIQKLQEQDLELYNLQNEEQKKLFNIIETKNSGKYRKSILRKSIVVNDNTQNSSFLNSAKDNNHRSSINAASIKNIDGKILSLSKQTIKFRPSISNLTKPDLQSLGVEIYSKQLSTPKSCLRISKRFESSSAIQQLMKTVSTEQRPSIFFNIKNIDGDYKKNEGIQEQELQEKIYSIDEQTSDDQNEYNIFGNKKNKQIINLLESMKGQQQFSKSNSRKSILRKDSVLVTNLCKTDKKKSVIFKTS